MAERQVILMRHGSTRLAGEKRLIGCYDEELDEAGLACAHRRTETFASCDIRHVFCSGLRRSADMGRIIAPALGAVLHIEADLNELNLGVWDGLAVSEVKRRWPREYRQRGEDILAFRPPGGENFHDLRARVLPAFGRVCGEEGNILLIGHRSVNRVILSEALGIPFEEMNTIPQEYGGYHILASGGGQSSFTLFESHHK